MLKALFGNHPRGLPTLFFSEMWERFSFYGMRALLTLYMVNHLGWDKEGTAIPIYGAYGALVYAFPVLGGYLANKFLGYRHAILLGGTLMAAGHFVLAIENDYAFYAALALLCVGNGFFKPNISSTVGRLYPDDQPQMRDQGFNIFYMGINIGALTAPLVCGQLGEGVDWHLGFGIAGVGMVIGLVQFHMGRDRLDGHGEPAEPEKLFAKTPVLGLNTLQLHWFLSFAVIPLIAWMFVENWIVTWIASAISIAVLGTIIAMTFVTPDATQKKRYGALLILMFFHMLFWSGFEQAGSSLNLLAKENCDRSVFGWFTPEASVFQFVNPFFIVVLVPFFNRLWTRWNPSIPLKFGLGLIQLGLGFGFLIIGFGTAEAGIFSMWWLVLAYLLHTTGELCISPVGLSTVTKLVPKALTGFVMGAWFLTISNAHLIAAALAGEAAKVDKDAAAEVKLASYETVYTDITMFGIGAGILLILLSPLVKKLLCGVK